MHEQRWPLGGNSFTLTATAPKQPIEKNTNRVGGRPLFE